jgi:hypothetical protein
MAAKLPYLSSPGTVNTVLERIRAAATPPTVNADFAQTKLKIKGGGGRAIPPFLKKIGFVAGDGTPTSIYERFRNPSKTVSGAAVAEAIRYGYKPLFEVNEYAHELPDKDLKGLIVQVTGLGQGNRVVEMVFGTVKRLKSYADFEADTTEVVIESAPEASAPAKTLAQAGSDFRIGYTINLNLPASTNVEVFNAIFKSLKEHLLHD